VGAAVGSLTRCRVHTSVTPVPGSSGDAHDDAPPLAARIDEPMRVGDVDQVVGPFADRPIATRLGKRDEDLEILGSVRQPVM
jgi:hypothetical protein